MGRRYQTGRSAAVTPDPPVRKGPTKSDFEELINNSFCRKFSKEPKPNPKQVCFDIESLEITHTEVLFELQKYLKIDQIVGIRFENFEAIVNPNVTNTKNRWIITCKDIQARN